ncbi:MAG TPA: O-antigen ligase family protein [Verrucomicrobiae bacterium]|nr:O-antigen ligase family protein [Verrucomicrobiae bacterium]
MAESVQAPDNSKKTPTAGRAPLFTLRASDVQLYRICDDLSGLLIFPMLVFSPWAFGTTQSWSIWTMNMAGYALGCLLLVKLFIRGFKGYTALRWENLSLHSTTRTRHRRPLARLLVRCLAGLTLAVLAFCLVSALNARATYNPDTRLFDYHQCLAWLPHSLDSHRSWFAFWMYLGLAGSFWGLRDWLQGMTPEEQRAVRAGNEDVAGVSLWLLSGRLRQVLWVLCLNGALLGLESIVQRASGSSKLLFLVQPLVNPEGVTQFGPYAYRGNAADYFNLLWPVCLGFWWTLQRSGGRHFSSRHLLLFCAAIMAACPIISSSRGGALVAAGILVVALVYLMATNLSALGRRPENRGEHWNTALMLGVFLILALALGWYFGWKTLSPRMDQITEGFNQREEMFDAARPMAADYPMFGTGPGTFGTVFRLYLISSATYWPDQLHNDWLETRITFGWTGFIMVLAALMCVVLRWFVPGGIRGGRRFVGLIWLALTGCLIEAREDMPFQIHSILFLFLVLCAVLFNLSRRSGASSR